SLSLSVCLSLSLPSPCLSVCLSVCLSLSLSLCLSLSLYFSLSLLSPLSLFLSSVFCSCSAGTDLPEQEIVFASPAHCLQSLWAFSLSHVLLAPSLPHTM